jgi:hypothetical protein
LLVGGAAVLFVDLELRESAVERRDKWKKERRRVSDTCTDIAICSGYKANETRGHMMRAGIKIYSKKDTRQNADISKKTQCTHTSARSLMLATSDAGVSDARCFAFACEPPPLALAAAAAALPLLLDAMPPPCTVDRLSSCPVCSVLRSEMLDMASSLRVAAEKTQKPTAGYNPQHARTSTVN